MATPPEALSVLVVDDFHPSFIQILDAKGFHVSYRPEIKENELISELHKFHILAIRSKLFVSEKVMDAAPGLLAIARGGAGLDNIDEAGAKKRHIQLFNAPEGNRDAVGEHTVGMILALSKRIVKSDKEVRQGIWDREGNRGFEIGNRTIGILGYGNMGRALSQRLVGFGCKVIAYDKYLEHFPDQNARQVEMAEFREKADIVSLHLPLTAETRLLINTNWIDQMVKPFYLINVSRGAIVNTRDVIDAMERKKIVAFGADVLENENLSSMDSRQKEEFKTICELETVILSPHIGGWTEESSFKIAETLANKLAEAFRGNKNLILS